MISCVLHTDLVGLSYDPMVGHNTIIQWVSEIKLPVRTGKVYFRVQACGQAYRFYATNQPGKWQTLSSEVDGRILSSPVAGGFTGTFIGMFASSNGESSQNFADFDWFEYQGR